MSVQMAGDSISPMQEIVPPSDDRIILKWLESQPSEVQSRLTQEIFDDYLTKAAQPRNVSGNACIKLCYYIEQCMRSKSSLTRDVIFAEKRSLDLFYFYIEWNEKNQARSMRQIIELISTMVAKNPSEESRLGIKKAIVERDMAIVTHQAAQPLVKPAFKSLESLMGKGTIAARDLLVAYQKKPVLESLAMGQSNEPQPETEHVVEIESDVPTKRLPEASNPDESPWDSFFSEMFDWMTYADISPAAGKFLVTVFRDLRTTSGGSGSSANNTASWQRWIRQGLGRNPKALENVKNYLFPPLFKLDRVGSLSFLEDLSRQSPSEEAASQDMDTQSLLQLSAMETGKKAGLVEEPDTISFSKVSKKPSGAVILQEGSIGLLLTHESESVRSLAFSVLVSSSSTIRPFSNTALEILRANMCILYCDTDAKFRNEILSSTKHMVERLRGATSLLAKEIESLTCQINGSQAIQADQQEEAQKRLDSIKHMSQHHDDFVTWYVEFLLLELIPTASYQRHTTSLKAISLFLKSGVLKQRPESRPLKTSGNNTVWPYSIGFFTKVSMRLLMDLLLDPFEDVRSGATAILKLAAPCDFELEQRPLSETKHDASIEVTTAAKESAGEESLPLGLLLEFIRHAEDLSKNTGRADHSDGVARSYELLYGLQTSSESRLGVIVKLVEDLETKVEIAEHSLGQAVFEAPIHGNFAAITFVWDTVNFSQDFEGKDTLDGRKQLEALQKRMASCCSRVWLAVKDILCNDSPEGYLPEDLDEVDEVDTKDVLSYSFRAIHESSNLMRSLVNTIKLKLPTADSSTILPTTTFIKIANLSFEQITTLRHRGAFSTVSSTFASCCQASVHPNMAPMTAALLTQFHLAIEECIELQESTSRRSAGIPAAVTGIISARASQPSSEAIIKGLVTIAQQPARPSIENRTQYPQVHALNSLKEIIKATNLGVDVESYIVELFELAGTSFESKVYPIKNCGLLLIRSLFDHIFGTNTGKAVIERGWDGKSTTIDYQRYPALVKLILRFLADDSNHSIFPALDVLRRAGPPPAHRARIELIVIRLLEKGDWQIRSVAADCLASFWAHTCWLKSAVHLLRTTPRSTNHRQGQLMAVRAALARGLAAAVEDHKLGTLLDAISIFRESWVKDFTTFNCFEIVTKHAEIRQLIVRRLCQAAGRSMQIDQSLRLNAALSAYQKIDLRHHMQKVTGDKHINHYPAATRAFIHNEVYSLAMKNDVGGIQDAFDRSFILSSDAAVAFLEACSTAFPTQFNSITLKVLCGVCASAIKLPNASVKIAATQGLCAVLDQNFPPHRFAEAGYLDVMDIVLKSADNDITAASPALKDARLSMNGWVSLFRILQRMARSNSQFNDMIKITPEFRAWSLSCIEAGKDDVAFDTRFAAAQALSNFYIFLFKAMKRIPNSETLITTSFGLYAALNDDDTEIRNEAARAISTILQTRLVPQAATTAFAKYLLEQYSDSQTFMRCVTAKMTGTLIDGMEQSAHQTFLLKPMAEQTIEAPIDGSILFAEEKQNLWLDEIANAKLWANILAMIPPANFGLNRPGQLLHPLLSALVKWVRDSIYNLKKSAMTNEHAVKWTSSPEVFSVLMRAITAINSVMDYLELHFLPAIERNPGAWADRGHWLQKNFHQIVLGLDTFLNLCTFNRVHPILIQAVMARVSNRVEVRSMLAKYGNSIPKVPENLGDLEFPLQNGNLS